MPKGMIPIFTRNISGVNNITLQNIPQTFNDLKIVMSLRCASATDSAQGAYIQFNGIGGTSYSGLSLRNTNNSVSSYRSNGSNAILELDIPNSANETNIFGFVEVYIPNYTSNLFKQILANVAKEDNTTTGFTYNILRGNLFRANGPITSMQIGTNITSPNFANGSTITLYGIAS